MALSSYDKYILLLSSAPMRSEALGVFLREYLIRYNYSSSCLKDNPNFAISKGLPNGYRFLLNGDLKGEMKEVFKYYKKHYLQRIRIKIKSTLGSTKS